MASIPADHTELPCVVTQRGMSGRLRSVDEHYRFEETSIRCPENAAASLPFALCASLAAAVRRWLKMGGSWPSSQIPSHPTGKALCAKGRASPELVEATDRLLYPMRRTRPKGDPDPGWQRITWEEALDETATAMRRIAAESGREAVAFAVTTPSGTAISDAAPWVDRLINAFGSPNTRA